MDSSSEFQSRNTKGCFYTPLLPVSNHSPNESQSITKTITHHYFTTLITILIIIYYLNMFLEFSLCPQPPIIQINSFFLSNFTVSDTKLAAVWVANLTVFNPSFALQVSLDQIDSLVLYKEDGYPLSVTSLDGFHLGLRGHKNVQMMFTTTGWEGDQPIVEYPVLREIRGDLERGTLPFSMRMSMWATYKISFVSWTRSVLVNSFCLDLDVGIVARTGNGTLIGGGLKDCLVLVRIAAD